MTAANQFSEHGFLIRQRSAAEIFDLACALLKTVGLRGLSYACLLWLPVFLLDLFLALELFGTLSAFPLSEPKGLLYLLGGLLLIFLQADFVFSPMVLFLGEWFFHPTEKISFGKIWHTWFSLLPQILFYLVLCRIVTVFNRQISNILLLEKTPFIKRNKKLSTSQRADLFFRSGGFLAFDALIQELIFIGVIITVGYSVMFFWTQLFFNGASAASAIFNLIVFPIYCWFVVFFLCLYKFLTYLHLRIVQEGWDLELVFKAEYLRNDQPDEIAGLAQTDLFPIGFFSTSEQNPPDQKKVITAVPVQPRVNFEDDEEIIWTYSPVFPDTKDSVPETGLRNISNDPQFARSGWNENTEDNKFSSSDREISEKQIIGIGDSPNGFGEKQERFPRSDREAEL